MYVCISMCIYSICVWVCMCLDQCMYVCISVYVSEHACVCVLWQCIDISVYKWIFLCVHVCTLVYCDCVRSHKFPCCVYQMSFFWNRILDTSAPSSSVFCPWSSALLALDSCEESKLAARMSGRTTLPMTGSWANDRKEPLDHFRWHSTWTYFLQLCQKLHFWGLQNLPE